MDVKRLQLWEGRHATMMSNDSLRVVVEDQGAMVLELSNLTASGGRLNAHPLYWFRGKGATVGSDANASFYKESQLLYQLGGNFLSFPNFGPPQSVKGVEHLAHGYTANNLWTIIKYGTDSEIGANWVLSQMRRSEEDYPFVASKIDMMLPGHPVLYTSVTITNEGSKPLAANIGWHNTVGSPFLEEGCVISVAAEQFCTVPQYSEFDQTGRLAMGIEFDDLKKAPLRKEGTCDLTVVPGLIGYTDFVTGVLPIDSKLGWSNVVNPRSKMMYFSFFTGAAAAEEKEIILHFNNLWMQYGGRNYTPWALYDGGTDNTFCLGMENSLSHFADGLGASMAHQQLMGSPTIEMISPAEPKVLRYGTAFFPYEQAKMGLGVDEVEQVVEGLVLKKGKAYAFIEADSTFHFLKVLEAKLLG